MDADHLGRRTVAEQTKDTGNVSLEQKAEATLSTSELGDVERDADRTGDLPLIIAQRVHAHVQIAIAPPRLVREMLAVQSASMILDRFVAALVVCEIARQWNADRFARSHADSAQTAAGR